MIKMQIVHGKIAGSLPASTRTTLSIPESGFKNEQPEIRFNDLWAIVGLTK